MTTGRKRAAAIGGAALLVIGAAGGGAYAWQHHSTAAASTTSTTTLPTAEVIRTELVSRADEDGTLGFGPRRSVLAGASGRITWLPSAGAVLERGDRAYGVDGHGIGLFYGSTPFWRTLRHGMADGYDVLELERNLDALGYGDHITVDRTFTAATKRAVRKWQRAMGMARTGTLEPGDVVVQPGAVRVAEVRASLSGRAGGVVYSVTGTQRQVTADLSVSDAQTLARKGAAVEVTLPGGRKVRGTVSSIGTVAAADASSGSDTGNAKITVTVTLEASAVAALDGAPVTVAFASAVHENVLAVPINSLLAASDTTYSVEVVPDSGPVRSVPVRLGIFDGDNVEVTGALNAGDKVRVPQS
ncbi:peptidoglycan-binding protein [Actinoplanes sp. NPDC049548]|uniref:peptidoglycan-binding protein n=1 Tax=Actinoplanes sp. NPDC049548 TaxID=3155152 RepID=UPI003423E5AD